MSDPRERDLLDLPATPARIRAAAGAAGASPSAVQHALVIGSASPSPAEWLRFISGALLMLGAALLLSGIVCFFAFNWESLGRYAKFALLQAGVAVAAGLAWWKLRELSGRVALFAASVLVGPLFGVYGQTYQTGADPWGLFAVWALLIAPWVVVSHFSALWILEVALVDTAICLFSFQVPDLSSSTWGYLFIAVGLLHALAVAAWEWQYWHTSRRGISPWLHERWAPRLLVMTMFVALLIPSIARVIDFTGMGKSQTIALGVLVSLIVVTFVVYRQVREDLFMLTAAGGSVLTMVTVIVGRFLFEDLKLEVSGALLMAIFIIAEVTLSVSWLRRSVRGEVD